MAENSSTPAVSSQSGVYLVVIMGKALFLKEQSGLFSL
jgi:hypothetical protein